jgi:hypothetical protein
MQLELEYLFPNAHNPSLITVFIDSVNIDNNGIGSYEFWGARGYDQGSDYVAEINISLVTAETYAGKSSTIKPSFYEDIAEFILNDSSLATSINEYYC